MRTIVQVNTPFVRAVLAHRNKSEAWLAKKLKVKKQYVSMLLSHTRNPSGLFRDKIQAALPGLGWDQMFIMVEPRGGKKR